MLQFPPQPPTQLRNNDIAIPQQIDIEIHMRARFPGDIHLWRLSGQKPHHLTHGRHFQARADHQHEIDLVAVVQRQSPAEGIREVFTEEGDVGLHDACDGDFVILVVVVGAVFVVFTLLFVGFGREAAVAAFALDALRADAGGGRLSKGLDTALAARDPAGFEVVVDGGTGDFVGAFQAGGGGEGAVALDEVRGEDAGVGFDVVDVLGVVCEELGSVLEEADEGVGGREGRG